MSAIQSTLAHNLAKANGCLGFTPTPFDKALELAMNQFLCVQEESRIGTYGFFDRVLAEEVNSTEQRVLHLVNQRNTYLRTKGAVAMLSISSSQDLYPLGIRMQEPSLLAELGLKKRAVSVITRPRPGMEFLDSLGMSFF